MEKRHVTKNYLNWAEGKLNVPQQERIEKHLQDCPDCRKYYKKMSSVFSEKADLADLPRLKADPFLPTRIRTLAENRAKSSFTNLKGWQWAGALRLAISSTMVIAAITIGIYLGKDLAVTEQYSESDLISDYYQAFARQNYAANWEYVLEESNGETQ